MTNLQKIKGLAPEDSSKWKCDWLSCDHGLGLAGRGLCSTDGTWGIKNCKKFDNTDSLKNEYSENEKCVIKN